MEWNNWIGTCLYSNIGGARYRSHTAHRHVHTCGQKDQLLFSSGALVRAAASCSHQTIPKQYNTQKKHWQKQWPSNRKPLDYSQLDTVLSTINCLKQTNRFRVNLADRLLFRVKAKQHLIKMQYIYKLNTLSPNPGPTQFFIHSCTMPNRKST